MTDPHVDVTKTEARAGTTPHVVRYVLMISLILAVLALGGILIAQ